MKSFNKSLNKTFIALSLSLFGAVSSMSALAMATEDKKIQEIEIEAESHGKEGMNIFVSVDGEVTSLKVPEVTLGDKAEIEKLLADVPADARDKVMKALDGLGDHARIIKLSDGESDSNAMHWVHEGDSSDSKVIIMEIDDEVIEGGEAAHKIIKKVMHSGGHEVFKFNHSGGISADSIISMLKHAELNADDLNKIQQALDEKR